MPECGQLKLEQLVRVASGNIGTSKLKPFGGPGTRNNRSLASNFQSSNKNPDDLVMPHSHSRPGLRMIRCGGEGKKAFRSQ